MWYKGIAPWVEKPAKPDLRPQGRVFLWDFCYQRPSFCWLSSSKAIASISLPFTCSFPHNRKNSQSPGPQLLTCITQEITIVNGFWSSWPKEHFLFESPKVLPCSSQLPTTQKSRKKMRWVVWQIGLLALNRGYKRLVFCSPFRFKASDLAKIQDSLLETKQNRLLSNRAGFRSGLSNTLGKDPARFPAKKQKSISARQILQPCPAPANDADQVCGHWMPRLEPLPTLAQHSLSSPRMLSPTPIPCRGRTEHKELTSLSLKVRV